MSVKEQVIKPIYFSVMEGMAGLISFALGSKKSSLTSKSCLILPSADAGNPGSLGDDAMVSSIVQYLRKNGVDKIDFFRYFRSTDKYLDDAEEIMVPPSLISLVLSLPSLVKSISRYDIFICVGADVLDGYYSEDRSLKRLFLVDSASKAGLKSVITGFSYKEGASPLVAKKFQSLHRDVWVCCRDAVSRDRLCKATGMEDYHLTTDVAFLLKPNYQSKISVETISWIKNQKLAGKLVVGVNINPHILAKLSDEDEKRLFLHEIRLSLQKLYEFKEGHVAFLGIPHDNRPFGGSPSDVELVENVFSNLPEETKSSTMVMEMPFRAADVKAICGDLDLLFSGRMHLAIASLGQGTPALCLTYQDKFEGLFKHFEMTPLTISPSSVLDNDFASKTLQDVVMHLDKHAAAIRSILPLVERKALVNLASLFPEEQAELNP